MSRYARKHLLQNDAIVDSVKINDELNQALVPYNSGLDANNFDNGAFTINKLAPYACHELVSDYNPFSGSVTLDKSEVDSRGWTFPSEILYSFTASDEGVIVGSYSGTIKKYAQTVAIGEMGWAVAAFLDGRMIARTELNTIQMYSIDMPFMAAVEKGSHTLQFGYRGLSYTTSVSGTNVFAIDPPVVWWVVKKR